MLENVLKIFQMSEQYWGCLDKMSEVNFSPAETLRISENCKSLVKQDKCNIEIFLSPDLPQKLGHELY